MSVAEKPLLIISDSERRIRVFFNVCRHRGALLCEQPSGELSKDCVQCSYHAWAYNSLGQLIRAPNMQSSEYTDEFCTEDFGLVAVQYVEWAGFLLINFDNEATFANDFQPVVDTFLPWSLENLRSQARVEYSVGANWKLLFQNFSECYHCPTVHPVLNRLTPYKSASNDLVDGAFQGGPMLLSSGVETMSIDGRKVAPPLDSLSREQQNQVGYYTLFPTMFISPHPDYVMVHYLTRNDVGSTSVACEFLFDPRNAPKEADVNRAVEFWDTTNRQDWHVCELVQKGMSAGIPPGPYSPLEPVLPRIDEHYLRCMN